MTAPVAEQNLYVWDDGLGVARLAIAAGMRMPDDVGELLTLAELGRMAERPDPAATEAASTSRRRRAEPPTEELDGADDSISATPELELCPGCGYREVVDDKSGFCLECSTRAALRTKTLETDAKRAKTRNEAWRWRTPAGQEAAAIRSARRRTRAILRPKQLPDPRTDPWMLGEDAVHKLRSLRPIVQRWDGGTAHDAPADVLDEAIELVRQLAWGPVGEGV